MSSAKQDIVTFKVNHELAEQLKRMPNRSEFIRAAVLQSLDNACPLCQGTGLLSIEQKEHWEEFARNHKVAHCNNCDAYHLVCSK